MAAYLLCLTAGGGVPLFARTKGEIKPLPFPLIGSLNGVHMFANTYDVSLLTTNTEDTKVVWKVFHESITLILITKNDHSSDYHNNLVLEHIFLSMVLLIGLDDLVNFMNVERLKRELKCCYRLIDILLEKSILSTFSDLTNAVEVVLTAEKSILQGYLDHFINSAGSIYGCLLLQGKIVVATKKWWSLTEAELVLLQLVVNTAPKSSTKDIPVFLPHGSPTVPHRLLTFQLIQGMEVCVLCGPTPTLTHLEKEINTFWKNSYEVLKATSRIHPRNFSLSIPIDLSILGFILVNVECHKCLCTVHPREEDTRREGKTPSPSKRKELLRAFYKSVFGTLFFVPNNSSKEFYKGASGEISARFRHTATETYLCCDTHKCYAIVSGPYFLIILFNANIPIFALRSISHRTLAALTKDKVVHL